MSKYAPASGALSHVQFWFQQRDVPLSEAMLSALEAQGDQFVEDLANLMKEAGLKNNREAGDDSDSDDDTTKQRAKSPFNDKFLRKKFRIHKGKQRAKSPVYDRYHKGESCSIWSEILESASNIKIISRLDNRSFSKLPLSSARKRRESKVVGFASHAFHVPTGKDDLFPGYIAGDVVLPPRGIKDAEGVGLCSQVFNIGGCQANSVEFAMADPSGQDGEFDPKTAQRFLLSKGDMIQIPPGNVYRIENHSKTEKATFYWTIVKCTSRAEQEDDEVVTAKTATVTESLSSASVAVAVGSPAIYSAFDPFPKGRDAVFTSGDPPPPKDEISNDHSVNTDLTKTEGTAAMLRKYPRTGLNEDKASSRKPAARRADEYADLKSHDEGSEKRFKQPNIVMTNVHSLGVHSNGTKESIISTTKNSNDNDGSTHQQNNQTKDPLYWLAGGEKSSDDESWDWDGPMILPSPPL